MRVLGIEGTAWAASAACYDAGADDLFIETEAYQPKSGGIHPREAAEHMAEHLPTVAESVLETARERYGTQPVDAVAFSRGPGLGPCLRIAGTTARALAQRLDVPLVGVNHMVAHLEIGRQCSGFADPICLNASGANAHVLGYRNGRYRVLGETMDTGVGNAIDKFTRHLGWSHPGGPKVEEAARGGEFLDLPYVVKGMDFSFSGITTAATEAVDEGAAVEDVCFSLQEHVFAMLTEVSERALSLTDADELVLGGGVGQNRRLQGMLTSMCEQRGAEFFVPEDRLLRDNAGMIAVLGATMYEAGDVLAIEGSSIDADFRPDQVPVTWRDDRGEVIRAVTDATAPIVGAEATISYEGNNIRKVRDSRSYRHPTLDERLRRTRTRAEARLLHEARRAGVPTPVVRDIALEGPWLTLDVVGRVDLREKIADGSPEVVATLVEDLARSLARLHDTGIVHGDPTTRNVRVSAAGEGPSHFLIDFGLGFFSRHPEDHAMDLHVFEGSLAGTAENAPALVRRFESAYAAVGDEAVLERLEAVQGRGRYQ